MNLARSLYHIISTLETLTPAELSRLPIVIDTFLSEGQVEPESPEYVCYKFIERGRKLFGPYRYRRVWMYGRLISVYEGKAAPGEYEAWLKSQAKQREQ